MRCPRRFVHTVTSLKFRFRTSIRIGSSTLVPEDADPSNGLPMVLDDVLVNFDEQRTLAAVETLLEFAGHGRQIVLFTCHAHLARLFESKGIELIRLPASEPRIEERRAG